MLRPYKAQVHVWRALPDYPNPAATIVSPASAVPLELFRQYMNEYEIARAVLVQPIYPGQDNSYVAELAASEPETLKAVCVVDPRAPDAAERLDYWVRERGCAGLRFRPRIPDEAAIFGDPSTFPLWEYAQAHQVVVSLLMNAEHLPIVAVLAARFPRVSIIIDHLGHPDVAAGTTALNFKSLLGLARSSNVYAKVSGFYYFSQRAYPFEDCTELVRAVYDAFAARLIWGSDFPHVLLKVGYRRNLLLPERAFTFLSAQERELVMGRTPRGCIGDGRGEAFWIRARTNPKCFAPTTPPFVCSTPACCESPLTRCPAGQLRPARR